MNKKKSISNLVNWKLNKKKIFHKSGKFFQIISIRAVSNFYKKKWDQPIIVQNEKGILGILMKKYNGRTKYLLQAKIEPGNINKLQLSPTVQATKSNYSRVYVLFNIIRVIVGIRLYSVFDYTSIRVVNNIDIIFF